MSHNMGGALSYFAAMRILQHGVQHVLHHERPCMRAHAVQLVVKQDVAKSVVALVSACCSMVRKLHMQRACAQARQEQHALQREKQVLQLRDHERVTASCRR